MVAKNLLLSVSAFQLPKELLCYAHYNCTIARTTDVVTRPSVRKLDDFRSGAALTASLARYGSL